jgi:hypothetical protein
MINWYNDFSKSLKSISFIVFWSIFLIVAPKYFSFLFLNIYLPLIYPLILIIFISLELNHPHLLYLFELKQKYPFIFLNQMLWLTYYKTMYVMIIMIAHIAIMVSYNISFTLSYVMMLNVSTLWIHGMFHPLTTSPFYKILSFVVFFLSHHFLLDLSFYEAINVLYITPSNFIQIIIIIISFIILQCIHLLSIEKKVF